jgi:hypothetical protein
MPDTHEITPAGELRPERIQEPAGLQAENRCAGAPQPTTGLRPERIQDTAAFRALVGRRNWSFLTAEDAGADRLIGCFGVPRAEEVGALARLVLDVAPDHGSRPVFQMKAGTVTVSFGEDRLMSEVDVAFAHLFDSILPEAFTVSALDG